MSEPFLSEIRVISWNYAPKGWAFCDGRLLPINQNQALFSLLGTTYGGDGRLNFGLPNLLGKVPIHFGSGFTLGETGGSTSVTITQQTMPQHQHFMQGIAETPAQLAANASPAAKSLAQGLIGLQGGGTAPVNLYENPLTNPVPLSATTVSSFGGSQPHNNMMPTLVLNFIIALQGIFPSQT